MVAVNVELFDFGDFLVELYNFVDAVLNHFTVHFLFANSEHLELLNFELSRELFQLGPED